MSTSKTDQRLNPSSATRFRFQSLLLTTTIVAGIAALCGAYFRGASEAEQRCLLILWGAVAATFTALMLVYTWQRYRSEKKVGTVHFRLPWFMCFRSWLISPRTHGILLLVLSAFVAVVFTGQSLHFAEQRKTFWQLAVLGLNPGMLFSVGFISFWWSREFWIGEKGFVQLSSFRSWDKIKDCYPHKKRTDMLVFEYEHGALDQKIAVRVPPELREQVDTLISEKLGKEK